MQRECGELAQLFDALNKLSPDGLMVSNLGTLHLAKKLATFPLQADISFNLFNHLAAKFLQNNGLSLGAASLELSFGQLRRLVENSPLPIEVIVHGAYESMLCDHNIPAMSLPQFDEWAPPEANDRHYALLDNADEAHPLRIDQFGRNHIYFAKDLCLYPYLDKFGGIASYRIEAQTYSPELTGLVTHLYRVRLNNISHGNVDYVADELQSLQEHSPRLFGIGTYRFRQSKNSIQLSS